jgi:Fic family protein
MKRKLQGHYIPLAASGQEKARAFVPAALPPKPGIAWEPELRAKFDEALLALGRLDAAAEYLPDAALLTYMSIRKEAVLSSMIEGTQSSLSDLLLFEMDQAPGVPLDDVQEVSSYVAALDHGLQRLNTGFPLSLRLIREMHEILLAKGRGLGKAPGEFRRSQNWIGGTRPGNAAFVPPPADCVAECMGHLERFLHDQPGPTPALLKAALAHVQFETIHPFLDGNGRLGRLLITLLLCEQKVLRKPMLYLSLYFKLHRQQYYKLLGQVRIEGDWEAWLEFFADAVLATASQAISTSEQLNALSQKDAARIQSMGRAAASALQVHQALLQHPLATSQWLVDHAKLSPATVNKSLALLESMGMVKELTGLKRDRVYSYSECIRLLNQGTELLAKNG